MKSAAIALLENLLLTGARLLLLLLLLLRGLLVTLHYPVACWGRFWHAVALWRWLNYPWPLAWAKARRSTWR